MKRKAMEQTIHAQRRLLEKLKTCITDAYAAALCVEKGLGEEHVVITTGRLKTALDALREAGQLEALEEVK